MLSSLSLPSSCHCHSAVIRIYATVTAMEVCCYSTNEVIPLFCERDGDNCSARNQTGVIWPSSSFQPLPCFATKIFSKCRFTNWLVSGVPLCYLHPGLDLYLTSFFASDTLYILLVYGFFLLSSIDYRLKKGHCFLKDCFVTARRPNFTIKLRRINIKFMIYNRVNNGKSF